MLDSTYDLAVQSLRVYLGRKADMVRAQYAKLDAIPGFSAWQRQANLGRAIPSPQEIPELFREAVVAAFAKDEGEGRAEAEERATVLALFAQLNEVELRHMIAEFSLAPQTENVNILQIFGMIAASRNKAAIEPLVERLQADVIYPVSSESSELLRELQYRLDRSKTIGLLSNLGGSRAAEAIRPYLKDSDEAVRAAAQKALNQMAASGSTDGVNEA